MRGGIGRRVAAAERKVVAAARRGARGGLSEVAEKRIRAALLEIAELPAAASGVGDDEASLAAHRLMNGGADGAPGYPAEFAPAANEAVEAAEMGSAADPRSQG